MMEDFAHQRLWGAMDKASRIEYLRENVDLSYEQMAKQVKCSSKAISLFARNNGFPRGDRDQVRRRLKLERTADQIAPFYARGWTTTEIGNEIGISRDYVQGVITRRRQLGDERFPKRSMAEVHKRLSETRTYDNAPPRQQEASLTDIYWALRRETHPDGTPYTHDCVFDAMLGVGYKYRMPDSAKRRFSPRDFAAFVQDRRTESTCGTMMTRSNII